MLLLNDVVVQFGEFPNGETNMKYNQLVIYPRNNIITLKYERDQDLFNLFILKSHLNTENITGTTLKILYMPYSRMDRFNQYYTFNLKYVTKFINSMKFKHVFVIDAHSDVTTALLDKCTNLTMIPKLFTRYVEENGTEDLVIMYPDNGAEKRYGSDFSYPTVVGAKERDFNTGEIIKYVISGADVTGKNVVIIDDLCSKGGTFINAGKALKEKGAKTVTLIVSHCEDNIFNGEIPTTDIIDKVYTTNSIVNSNFSYDKINIIPAYKSIKKESLLTNCR